MGNYALTIEKLHVNLIKNRVFLRRSDIERIITRIEERYPCDSEILRFERAYGIAYRYERMMIQPLRLAASTYSESWDGRERRAG